MAGEQQVKQRDNHQHERNPVHGHSSAAHPEQAQAKKEGGHNHQEVAPRQLLRALAERGAHAVLRRPQVEIINGRPIDCR
jgi:hypothetical protein